MKKILLLFSCLFLSSLAQEATFKSHVLGSNMFVETSEVGCFINDDQIGTIGIARLPFSLYILHSFYVGQKHRNQGYGTKLLLHACDQVVAKKPRAIFIQPGPFEITHGGLSYIEDEDEHSEKLTRLCKLYVRAGFRNVSKPVSLLAGLLYRCIQLPEDACYLMAK